MAVDVGNDLEMIIDGVPVAVDERPLDRGPQPRHRELVGRVPDGTEADVDRAVAVARAAFRDGRWHRMAMAGPRRGHEPTRRPARPRCRRPRPARDAPDRHVVQAPARVRLRVRERQPAVLRDADPEPRGQGRLRVQRQPHELRAARADRRGRPRSARGTTRCGWRSGRSARPWRPGTRSCSSPPSRRR